MEKFLNKLKNKENLSFEESKEAFKILMDGKASDQEIYDFLIFLSDKTLKFSSAFVVEKYRGKGIYSKLWNVRMEYCKENFKGYDVIAYCLPDSTHFYEKKGWEIGGLTTLMKSKID